MILREINRAIRQNSWLSISYENENVGTTYYWIRIRDVNLQKQQLLCDMYNIRINSRNVIEGNIFLEKIKSAQIIEGTIGESNDTLIDKIEKSPEIIDWLNYDELKGNILEYYAECAKYDKMPYLKEFELLSGIHKDSIHENAYQLNDEQFICIINNFYRVKLKDMNSINLNQIISYKDLGLNVLGISFPDKKLFSLLYKTVSLDIKAQKLIFSEESFVNYNILNGEHKYSIVKYIDADIEYFVNDFRHNPTKYIEQIRTRLKKNELIDERPYIMTLNRDRTFNFMSEYYPIMKMEKNKTLTTPLKAFFGNMSNRLQKTNRKVDPITLLDNKVDMDQLRVIFNAMKNPITYVQGPPGTGKTQTILNILVSALINNKTVLLCSHNNKPLDNIVEKIKTTTYKGVVEVPVMFPYLRIGNQEEILKTLEYIKSVYQKHEKDFDKSDDEKNKQYNIELLEKSKNTLAYTNECLKRYEEREELLARITAVEEITSELPDLRKIGMAEKLEKMREELETIGEIDEDAVKNGIEMGDVVKRLIHYQTISRLKLLSTEAYKELKSIVFSDSEERAVEFNRFIRKDENLIKLLKVFPVIITTNLSLHNLGSVHPHFDIMLMDEAGQCSPAPAVSALSRAKNILLVGDENQLRPVCMIDSKLNAKLMEKYKVPVEYDYLKNSILSVLQSVDRISKFILMKHHYRSRKKIINFSNVRYYDNRLIIEKQGVSFEDVHFFDIKTNHVDDKNTSIDEIVAIKADIQKNGYKNVGIITPFRNQADLINEEFKDKDMSIGTVHTFQGDERDVIYLSLAITPKSHEKTYSWVCNNKELINVATTRPREKLIIVGDLEEIERREIDNDDLNALISYVKSNGDISKVLPSDDITLNGQLNSYSMICSRCEKEFIKTISHYLSTNRRLSGKDHIKVSSVIKKCDSSLFDYFTRAEFDYVLYMDNSPVLVIEIDGIEHYTDINSIARDTKKEAICAENGLKLLRIPNIDVKRYEMIKEEIKSLISEI